MSKNSWKTSSKPADLCWHHCCFNHRVLFGYGSGSKALATQKRSLHIVLCVLRSPPRNNNGVNEELADVANDARDRDQAQVSDLVFVEVRDHGDRDGERLLAAHEEDGLHLALIESEEANGDVVHRQKDEVHRHAGDDDAGNVAGRLVQQGVPRCAQVLPDDADEVGVADQTQRHLVRLHELLYSLAALPDGLADDQRHEDRQRHLHQQVGGVDLDAGARCHDPLHEEGDGEDADEVRGDRQHQRQRAVPVRLRDQRDAGRQRGRNDGEDGQADRELFRSQRNVDESETETWRDQENCDQTVHESTMSSECG